MYTSTAKWRSIRVKERGSFQKMKIGRRVGTVLSVLNCSLPRAHKSNYTILRRSAVLVCVEFYILCTTLVQRILRSLNPHGRQ
jgi:hypothetical protein